MKNIFKNNLLLAVLLTCILAVSSTPAWGDSTNDTNSQTNSSGSNTQITGGYTATTTNNNDGQTNTTTNTTTNNSTTNGSDIPVGSANAPSYSAMSQDVCSMGISGSISTLGVGLSGGKHVRDLNCERIKLSKVLFDYGMKVAAVSILCQDERVFFAMGMAGRPNYESYISKLEIRSRIDAELAEIARQEEAERLRKEQEALARKIAEEKAKLATLKEQEEVDNIIIETDLETKEQRIINVHGE